MQEPLTQLILGIPGFQGFNHADKIRLFAWFMHSGLKKDRFQPRDLADCYRCLNVAPPQGIRPFLVMMEQAKPKQMLRDGKGWYLEHVTREKLNAKYGVREVSIQVSKLLEDLPSNVPDHAEREFLEEALICYKRGAFRAAVVMTWNLAYWHVCQHVLRHKLAAFNSAYPSRLSNKWPKAKVQVITKFDDFSVDLMESEVLEIAKSAVILTNDVYKILVYALGKRNSAAHPSSVKIQQLQAESLIDDLIKNVVLVLPL